MLLSLFGLAELYLFIGLVSLLTARLLLSSACTLLPLVDHGGNGSRDDLVR